MNFENQHIIVTGGSSGIGKATAKLFFSKGSHISIIARNQIKLEEAKKEIEITRKNRHQQIYAVSADVSNYLQIKEAIEICVNKIKVPDILITSAGIANPGYFHELSNEIFEKSMSVNYFGSLYAIKSVLPSMKQQQGGQIIIVSSGAGLIGIYGYTSYSPSKFALRGLAESLRGELKLIGVRVAIVYPPDTDTPMLEAENKVKPPEMKRITATAQVLKAETVAKEIYKGVIKKSFTITPNLEIAIIEKLHSLLLPLINWYCDYIVNKERNM
jgi:3-dehydrosphinganine reductase